MYQWGEAPLAEDAPWLELLGLNVSEVIPEEDANGEGDERTRACTDGPMWPSDDVCSSVASPKLYDTQFCVDTTVAFQPSIPMFPSQTCSWGDSRCSLPAHWQNDQCKLDRQPLVG